MRIAVHQPNFIPWFPYFYKMASVDIFIVHTLCQFEKGGFQNRCMVNGKWWTKPVEKGLKPIIEKKYSDGNSLYSLNMAWIDAIKRTLSIETQIKKSRYDNPNYMEKGTKGLINLICDIQDRERYHRGVKYPKEPVVYVCSPESKNKYLDEDLMRSEGIEIDYINVPEDFKISIFEAFDKWGIDGTKQRIPKHKPIFRFEDVENAFQKMENYALKNGTYDKGGSPRKEYEFLVESYKEKKEELLCQQ